MLKVKIPMIVSSNGLWSAYGYHGCERDPDWEVMEENISVTESEHAREIPEMRRVWVEVEVEIPVAVTVSGRVVE